MRASSNTNGGTIEIRLGSVTGPLIGSRLIPGTGGWNAFQDFTCPISGASGVQTLFLVFRGGGGFLVDVDYFSFTPALPLGNG